MTDEKQIKELKATIQTLQDRLENSGAASKAKSVRLNTMRNAMLNLNFVSMIAYELWRTGGLDVIEAGMDYNYNYAQQSEIMDTGIKLVEVGERLKKIANKKWKK